MRNLTFILLTLSALMASVGDLGAQEQVEFKVVVSAANPSDTLSTEALSRIFLKKLRTWSNGEPADPVDLESKSPVRESFSKAVHGRSVSAIKSYWQKMIFSGRDVPPAEKANDEEVLAYVSQTQWAIGYVSAAAKIGQGVKVVQIVE